MPERALQHIRFLGLVFAPFTPATVPGTDDAASKDWAATLGWARGRLGLAALSVRMTPVGNVVRPMEADEVDGLAVGYKRLVRAAASGLGCLDTWAAGTLARFYATPVWPWRVPVGTSAAERQRTKAVRRLRDRLYELKQSVELGVMGEQYEQVAAAEPAASMWFLSQYRR
ncbi:hypothetical protein C8A05DRAFT_39842 [Staphylotrichum tortipilum]|uniref:Uncharacterized protein n=1 Tax=Staphylotrichum tortipilum TaxID=2831512 RepID=A0AAN6MAK0_9PEZI|nr:hypothetical protein C8A05DRAFT_39842 [Staphylotrichum longicolle]